MSEMKLPEVNSDEEFIEILCQHMIAITDMVIKLDKDSDHEEAMVSGLLLLYTKFRRENGSWEGVTNMVEKIQCEVLEYMNSKADDENRKH